MKLKLAARLLLTFLGVFGCACAQSESHVVRMAESVTSTSPFPSPSTASMNNIAGNGTPTNGQVSLWPSKPAFTVRFAASLGSNTDSGSLEARQGYNYWSYMLNEVLGGFCIGLNCQHKLKVDLWILSDNLVPQVHLDNMVAAVEQGNADFLLGGNTNLASYDLEASQTAQRITMLCCHGPAPVYEIAANATKINPNNVDYLFGIQVSSDLYPNKLIRDIVVNEKSKLTAIIQVINTTQPNATAFTSTTCAAAANQLESILASGAYQAPPQYKVITVPIEQSGNLSYFQELSRNIKSIIVNGNHVDIVLACTLNVDGRNLLYSLQSEQVPLKGVFATVAPTIQSTVANLTTSGITMVDTLSAGQWHPELPFVDPNADAIWTNATSFANGFESYMTNSTGKDIAATYNNAGSAAGTFAIQIAIHNAFQFCDLSNWTGDVDTLFYSTNSPCSAGANKTGYELVLESLRTLNRDSFFGTIQFDGNQRNVGRDAVTLQLLGSVGRSKKIFGSIDFGLDADNTTLLVQEVVLPSQYETKQIVLPRAPRSYDPGCPDGQGLDSNNDCQPCPIGTSRTNAIQAGTLSGRFLCDTCNLTSYADKVGQSQCTHCPPGTVTKSKDAAGAFKSILGATSITMCVCAVGYYNETGLTGVPCSPCPSGATCAGDVEPPRATPGYWLDSSAPDYLSDVFSCSPSQYCPMNYATGQLCAAGYGGPLCSLCGYYNGNDSYPNYYSVFGNCITCPNKVENVLVFVAILVLWVLMNFFVIEKWEGTALGLEWLQLMYLVGTINTNWPQSTQQYFNLAKLFAFEVDIVSWQCISSSWNWMWDMVLQFVLPPFLVFCFLFFTKSGTLLKYVWRHGFSSATNQPATLRNSDEQHMKQHTSMGEESMFESMKTHPAVPTTTETVLEAPKEAASGHQRHDAGHGHSSGNTITKASFIGICVSVLEITYVASTYYAFSALAGINVSGTWVVMQAPYTNQTTTVIVIGAVGLVLYSLLYPGVIAFQLWKLSPDCPWRKRPPGQSRDEDAGGFREEENITAYGVLYEKFKVEKYYMAFVHLLHRLVFIAIVAVSEDVNLQLLLGILVTMAFAFLFLWTKPYYLQRTNMLQAILYTSVVVQLGIGTKFNNTFPYNNEAWDQAFAVLSIIAICTAGAGFVWISAMDVIEYICANLANQAVLGYLARRQGMTVKEQNANAHRIAQLVEVFDPVRLWSWLQDQKKQSPELFPSWWRLLLASTSDSFKIRVNGASKDDINGGSRQPTVTQKNEYLELFDELSYSMGEYFSEENNLGHLSTIGDAILWREITAKYPELITFLFNEDDPTADSWNAFFEDFYSWYWRIHNDEFPFRHFIGPLLSIMRTRERRMGDDNSLSGAGVESELEPSEESQGLRVLARSQSILIRPPRAQPPHVPNVARVFMRQKLAIVASWLAVVSEQNPTRQDFKRLVSSVALCRRVSMLEATFRLLSFKSPHWHEGKQSGKNPVTKRTPTSLVNNHSEGRPETRMARRRGNNVGV